MRRALLLLTALLLTGCIAAPQETPPRATGLPAASPLPDDPSPRASPEPTSPPPAAPSATPSTTPPPKAPPTATPSPTPPSPSPQPRARFVGCMGEGPVRFAVSPMRLEDFEGIVPYGLMAGAHVTPIDHMYFAPAHGTPRDAFEVRAIADGVVYNLQPRDIHVDTGATKAREWRMDIAHTCTFTSYFDLLTSLAPDLERIYNATQGGRTAPWNGIPVKAGQVVGRIGAQTLDFGVYDYNVTLPGFVVPSHYDREPWKVHTVDPFPWFDEPLRGQLIEKALRKVEPRAGKIDWDVDGALRGNWFAVGTNGYAGVDPRVYWEGHLAVAPHHLDPTITVFSVGNWSGQAAQFAIADTTFDPVNVTPTSALQKLVLHRYGQAGGRTEIHQVSSGIALVEMTGPRLLKAEVFPGKSALEVTAFTPLARTYER